MDTADISISTNGRDRRDPNQQNQRSVEANWCTGIYPTDFFLPSMYCPLNNGKSGQHIDSKKKSIGQIQWPGASPPCDWCLIR